MIRPLRFFVLWAAVALAVTAGPACGTSARAVDTCRTVEEARCDQGDKCPNLLAGGDIESCKRFYNVQCGRGVSDGFKEPSRSELDACIKAIQSSCAVAEKPELAPECYFIVANTPPPDTGAADSDATDGSDATDSADSAPPPDTSDSTPPPDTTDSTPPPDTTDSAPATDTADEADAG